MGNQRVWLGDESKRRTIATNAVNWAVRTHCSNEEFDAFYIALHSEMGHVAEVFAAGKIVDELSLAAGK